MFIGTVRLVGSCGTTGRISYRRAPAHGVRLCCTAAAPNGGKEKEKEKRKVELDTLQSALPRYTFWLEICKIMA